MNALYFYYEAEVLFTVSLYKSLEKVTLFLTARISDLNSISDKVCVDQLLKQFLLSANYLRFTCF